MFFDVLVEQIIRKNTNLISDVDNFLSDFNYLQTKLLISRAYIFLIGIEDLTQQKKIEFLNMIFF